MRAIVMGVVFVGFVAAPASAAQHLVPTKKLLVKNPPSGVKKIVWKAREAASAAVVSGDPTVDGATFGITLSLGGDQCFSMGAAGWSAVGTVGFKYSDPTLAAGAVKVALVKKTPAGTFLAKAIIRDGGAIPIAIAPGNPTTSYTTNFAIGTADEYCGGTATATPNPNDAVTFRVTNDGAPAACASTCGATSTSTSSTTSTSASSTTSTSFVGPCCNGDGFLTFQTVAAPGDCGDVVDAGGMVVANLVCGGYYGGGTAASVPMPWAAPDLTRIVMSITSCTGAIGNIGPTTSTQTGTNWLCTSAGCLFGAPVPIPNAAATATSTCVRNIVQGASGTVDCSTGATDVDLPLAAIVHLTGDIATDPMGILPGIQPCPLCLAGTCVGGTNNGMVCVPGNTAVNTAYPTSNDCPPSAGLSIGTLPIAFALASGTVTWTGTVATNDTGSTVSVQNRVFSGYCRDTNGTNIFQSPFQHCWENGMAVGAACAGVYETCEQRSQGAFGAAGAFAKTITAVGSASSLAGGPAPATLVAVFSIPPTFDVTVDVTHDLPGPGVVSLPGTATTCAAASPCP